jgi:hypothetical protein
MNKIEFIKILFKYKSDNIMNKDYVGQSSYDIAKLLHNFEILSYFGISYYF